MLDLNDIPFAIALGWTHCRNDDFIIELEKRGDIDFRAAFDALKTLRSDAVRLASIDIQDAWNMLRIKVVSGKISLRGIPFVAGRQIGGVGQFETSLHSTQDVLNRPNFDHFFVKNDQGKSSLRPGLQPSEIREVLNADRGPLHQKIPKNKARDLELYSMGKEICLRPKDWTGKDWWWRGIETNWSNLVATFPRGALGRASQVSKEDVFQNLTPLQGEIIKAYLSLRDDGALPTIVSRLDEEICKKVPRRPSTKTIFLAFKRYKELTGIDLKKV